MQKVSMSSSDLRDAFTVTPDGEIGDVKYDELKTQYPSLWALFDVCLSLVPVAVNFSVA